MKIDNEKIIAITEVGQAQPRLREALFMKNIKHLDNVNFICVDEDLGHDVVSEMLSMFTIECGEICSALSSKKLRIINKELTKQLISVIIITERADDGCFPL